MEVIEVNGVEVEIDGTAIKPYSDMDQTAVASNGALVAWDDGGNSWIQMWPTVPEDY
ncbi:MAG: hypothetical protein FWG40_00525 [Peptococcaceae bacterium]|nr:hypothetical protein [Peptococcaceae bacterium]